MREHKIPFWYLGMLQLNTNIPQEKGIKTEDKTYENFNIINPIYLKVMIDLIIKNLIPLASPRSFLKGE